MVFLKVMFLFNSENVLFTYGVFAYQLLDGYYSHNASKRNSNLIHFHFFEDKYKRSLLRSLSPMGFKTLT